MVFYLLYFLSLVILKHRGIEVLIIEYFILETIKGSFINFIIFIRHIQLVTIVASLNLLNLLSVHFLIITLLNLFNSYLVFNSLTVLIV
jgi:hypothetical protein